MRKLGIVLLVFISPFLLAAAPVYVNGNFVGNTDSLNLVTTSTTAPTVAPTPPTVVPTPVPTSLPTPLPTARPTALPTPPPVSNYTITSPQMGATVSGMATTQVSTTMSKNDTWWQSLDVDGVPTGINDAAHYLTLIWDSTTMPNGSRILVVSAHQMTTGTITGTASVTVNVANVGVATPTPKPATPGPTSPATAIPTAKPTSGVRGPRLIIGNSGNAVNPLVYDGAGAAVSGLTVTGSYVTVRNYDISNQDSNPGVSVAGSHVRVEKSQIHDLCNEGMTSSRNSSYVEFVSNNIVRASMVGAEVHGSYSNISDNEISDSQQYPRLAGGIFAKCVDRNGADADGIRFFGPHNRITGNHIYGIVGGTVVNPSPHIDAFQTFTEGGDDTIISGNRINFPAPWNANGGSNHVAMISGYTGRLQFDHNVFENVYQGIINGSARLSVTNNTFVNIATEAVEPDCCGRAALPTDEILRNIIYKSTRDSYTTSLVPVLSGNVCWPDCGSYPVKDPNRIVKDPLFVNPNAGDYHLQPTSPVPQAGAYPLQ